MPPKKTSTSTSAAAAAAAAAAAVTGSSGGKRRSRIQPIKDDRTRAVTLLKRRAGVFKKAFELSVLCQCDIGVIIFAPNGKLFEFTSAGDMDDLLLRYTEYIKPHEVKTNQDFAEGGDGQVGAPVQGESDDEGDTLLAPQPAHAAAAAAPTTAVAPAALHHPSQKHQHVPQQPVGAHLFAHHQQNHSHQSSYDSLPQAQQNLVRVQSQSDHQASYSQSPPQPITANPVQVPTGIAPAYQQIVPPLHSAGQFAPSEYHHQQQGTSYLAPITSPPPSVLQHGQQQQHGSYDEQQHHSRYEHSPQQHQHHQHQHHTSFPPPSVQNPATSHGGGAASGGTNGAPYDLFTSFHTTSPQTYLPPLTSARPEFAPQNSLLAAAITAPSSSLQRCESTDSRSHLTLHQEALGNSGIDPDLPTPILTPPSNNPSGHADTADSTRPSTKRDRDVASNNDRPQLAPIDAITSPTSDHPLPSPSNGPPTKRSKPNFARKTPFSLKLQIPGSSTPPTSSQNPNPTTSSTGGSRTGRESASASPSMACPPADGRGPVLLEPNPSSAGAGGPGSSPVTRSPMNATPGGSHINPFTGAPLRTSNGGGGPNSAHPASAFPLFSASTPNPGNASGYGAGGGGQSTRKSPFMHFKGTSNGPSNAPASSAYPAPISASAIPSPSGFFADRLPLPPPSSRGSGGSGNRPASSPVFPSPIPPIHGGYSSAFGSGGHHQHQHPLSRVTAGGGDTPNSDNGGGSSPAEVKREVGAPYPRPVAAAAGSSRAASDGYEVEWKREQGVGHAVE